jgi:hypothetical protein
MMPYVCSFALRTIASRTTLKSIVDNTSPCLSPCCFSKGSKQSFCIMTQYLTVVIVALVRRKGIELCHYYIIDFISCNGVVCCLEVYEVMMISDDLWWLVMLNTLLFSKICRRPNSLLLICLNGTLFGNFVLACLRVG